MPPNDLEAELLRRFQALKAPSTTPGPSFKNINDEQARKAKEEDDELERIADGRPLSNPPAQRGDGVEDEMARRMAKLKGIEYEVEDGDDREVDDFIASQTRDTSTTIPGPSTSEVRGAHDTKADTKGLEKEAREALQATNGYIDSNDKGDDQEEEEDDFETEDEILLRALEEAELDTETRSKHGKRDTDEDEVSYEKETEQDIITRARALAKQSPPPTETDEPGFSFPSLPTHIPVDDSEENDKEASAKMALLLGLSRPTNNPGPRLPSPPKDRKPGQGWNLPGYKDDNDEDPDSWCCICNKDAEVVCLGCDGDPYCEECWVEGHVGERHRTKRFATRGGRKAVGA